MSNSRPKVEGIAHGTIQLYPTIRLIIKCGDEVERVGGSPTEVRTLCMHSWEMEGKAEEKSNNTHAPF